MVAGVDPASTIPVASYDFSGGGGAAAHATVRSSAADCGAGQFEARTADRAGALQNEDFSFVIP